ncbi:hypothetical protein V8C42DRAFT_327051 [Trichoderma barbatum]
MLGAACMGGSKILSSFTVKNIGAQFFTTGVVMRIGVSLCSPSSQRSHHITSALNGDWPMASCSLEAVSEARQSASC